jgi:uncharacterized membrane protein SpoIIM required for sporulation
MVLEALANPIKVEKTPIVAFLLGILYSSVAVFLSLWIFRQQSSMIMILLTVMAALPLIYSTFKIEESKDIVSINEISLLKEHSKVLMILVFLFVGFVVSFSFWYVLFPTELTNILFQTQTQTISAINNQVAGHVTQNSLVFSRILGNNLRVLAFSFLFSVIYGMGIIFILVWNASVIGTAMGHFIENSISQSLAKYGSVGVLTYLNAMSMSILRYFTHGIPEMAAYFIGGLAGALVSIALVRKHFMTIKFERVLFDVTTLMVISLLLIVAAAVVEVYITPTFF